MRTADTSFSCSRDAGEAVCDKLVEEAAWRQIGNLPVEKSSYVRCSYTGRQEGHRAVDDDAVPVDVLLRLTSVHYGLERQKHLRFPFISTAPQHIITRGS